ncbi:MAG: 50S ribosomal protein L25 [bacterium]
MLNLTVQKRDVLGKQVKTLRLKGEIPVSMYGPSNPPVNLLANGIELLKIVREAGTNKVITVDFDGKKNSVLVREVQYHPVTAKLVHVSLYRLDMDKPVNVEVPFKIEGISMAVKNNVGFLVNPLDLLPIRALPSQIPEYLVIDISKMDNIGDSVLVKDLVLEKGIELQPKVKLNLAIVTIVPPQKEIVEEVKAVAATTETTEAGTDATAKPVEGAVASTLTPVAKVEGKPAKKDKDEKQNKR